jgi:hypothetical protein
MRWIAGLVAAVCLLAASGARPESPRTGDRGSVRLDAAPAAIGHIATRRSVAAPDRGLLPVALAAVAVALPRLDRISRVALAVSAEHGDALAPVPRSRGPPLHR